MSTPGPWALRGSQIRAENGLGRHVGSYTSDRDDGRLMAAAPELARLLREWAADYARIAVAPTGRLYERLCATRELLAALERRDPWEE